MVEDVLAIALIFGGGTLFLLAISPIGRALAERIRPRAIPVPEQDALLEELHQLRQDVAELAERLDFMERLQTQPRDAARLGPPA